MRVSVAVLVLPLLAALPVAAENASPYAAPFQLRGAVAGTAVKSDTAISMTDAGKGVASYLSASIKVLPDVAAQMRVGMGASAPSNGGGGVALMNPQLGVLWSPKISDSLRLSPFLSVTLPVGMGGGESPKPEVAGALASARLARFSLDSAIALPNYTWLGAGASLSWTGYGATAQAEITALHGYQSRGAESLDDTLSSGIGGLFLGYYLLPQLNLGAELRYQRFLSTPASVVKDPLLRDQLSFAVGARGHLKTELGTVRPGLSWGHGIGGASARAGNNVLLIDLGIAL